MLRRLGQNLRDLNSGQLSRLNAANEFLVLMVELTSGKGFQDVVEDSLDNLLRLHEPVYRAYEYLCFSYSYGVAIPTSVLERLDAEGRFHDLPNREGAQGFVFYDESRSELVRAGHAQRAEMARRLFEGRRSSATVLTELVKVVDVSSPLERRFISHLLRSLAYRRTEVVEEALPGIDWKVAECLQQASRVSELTIWRAFYLALDDHDKAARCVDAALAVEPVSSADCNLALNLFRERGRERDALPVLDRWIHSQAEWGGAGPAYLGLVERYGTESDQERAIDETSAWLAAHPDDNNVRTAHLGLVERNGTVEQTERVLRETRAWLHAHPRATDVWMRFITYLWSMGKFDDARAVVEDAIAIHSTNSNLVTHYLNLMEGRLDEPRTRDLYASLTRSFPKATAIKNSWARWLHTHNYRDEAEEVFKTLIAEHPRSFSHSYGHGRLLLDMERYGEAAGQFRRVLAIHRGHAMAHDGLALAVHGLARRAQEAAEHSEAARLAATAEREFKSAIHWAGVANDRQAQFLTHLGWFYVDRKRWGDGLGAFDQAANEDPEYFGNYWGQGRALVGLEQWRDAARALRIALEKAPGTLGPPASDDIRELIARCEAALTNSPHESQTS